MTFAYLFQAVAPISSMAQAPPRMFGAPPSSLSQSLPLVPPVMGNSPLAGPHSSTPSKIDPNQIPRPMSSSSAIVFETRQGNQVNSPPVFFQLFFFKELPLNFYVLKTNAQYIFIPF